MLAIIGGSGLAHLPELNIEQRRITRTPYGAPSCALTFGHINRQSVVFLARHGYGHSLAPHEINYRANLWTLKEEGIAGIIAIGAVAGIRADLPPGTLVVPHDIIDYTWGRTHTFFEGAGRPVVHANFGMPYDQPLRERLLSASIKAGLAPVDQAVYACTQGPRMDTAAEVTRIERDGGHIIGMTGMPEAALARELHLPYAHLCGVTGWAAGRCPDGGDCLGMFDPEPATAALTQVRQVLLELCK